MNGSTENRAPGAPDRSSGRSVQFSWSNASRMLPLVRHIVADVMDSQSSLDRMQSEKDRLDRSKRTLAWPERARRYQLDEEIRRSEGHLRKTLGELENLGLKFLNPAEGRVGFPTIVNKQKAYFSWLPGEETLSYWQYSNDAERRPIPASLMRQEARSAPRN